MNWLMRIAPAIIGGILGTAFLLGLNVSWQHLYCGQAWRDCRPSLISCEPVSKAQAEWDELQNRARAQKQ